MNILGDMNKGKYFARVLVGNCEYCQYFIKMLCGINSEEVFEKIA